MRGRPAHGNAKVKRITARPPKQTNPQGRARGNRARRRRSKPNLSLARGIHTESSPEAKTTKCGTPPPPPPRFRADQPTKGWHKDTPRTAGKNAPKSPTVVVPSFEIRSTGPDPTGDPIFKEYRPDIQSRLRYDRVGEKKHTRPAGWPHREATKDRWTEEAFVPIECAEKRHTTRYGWPHREGSAPTTREGARRVFVPTEIWDKLDPTGWPHCEDSNQTPGRWRKSLRSDRGERQTRPGRVTSSRRLDAKPKQRAWRNSASQR